jgi:inosine-uridine nucleoside N-ribohydrolase
MNKIILLTTALAVLCLFSACKPKSAETGKVNLILDTDFGPDYDDVGAIAVMHALADSGKVNILATIASTKYENVAANLNAFNTYFGRPEIPVGVPKGNALTDRDWQFWSDTVVARYPHALKSNDEAKDAVALYREILATQPDSSITLVSVGFLTNLANLLQSTADRYSTLSGPDLVKLKVKKLVSMAGKFPEGREYNVYKDSASSKIVFDQWPTEIIFSGWEIGNRIHTGLPLIQNVSIQNSPVKDVFRICIPKAAEDSLGRMSWDETAVLVAINGASPYYNLVGGKMVTYESGANSWDSGKKGHFYLTEKQDAEITEAAINQLIMHQPKNVAEQTAEVSMSGNPILPGWYADPEAIIMDGKYWIFPTSSLSYDEQVFLDAFSSKDLVNWEKHSHIIDSASVKWVKRAMWAPAIVKKSDNYYLFFAANDIQTPDSKWWNPKIHTPGEIGGIGVAIASKPEGPYKDYLGKPLINRFYNGAQPIDQFVFRDKTGKYLIYFGGWGHCNVGQLKDDFTGLEPFADGDTVKEITPDGYVEGSFMFVKNGKYYFMWSEGDWMGPDYCVAYSIADSPFGPFKRICKVLEQNPEIANGAGHHSVIQVPGSDNWYIVYHRRPKGDTDPNHRVTCIEKMEFDENGYIKPVKITTEGVKKALLK